MGEERQEKDQGREEDQKDKDPPREPEEYAFSGTHRMALPECAKRLCPRFNTLP